MALTDKQEGPAVVYCNCGMPPDFCGEATKEKSTAQTFEKVCKPWRARVIAGENKEQEGAIDLLRVLGLAPNEKKEGSGDEGDSNDDDGKTEVATSADAAAAPAAAPQQHRKPKGKVLAKITIQRLQRGKSKSVTSIVGLGAQLDALVPVDGVAPPNAVEAAKLMGKFFACASAVKKDSEDEIVIQGDIADRVATYLTEKLNIPADQIAQTAKAGKVKGRPPPSKR